MNSPAVLVPTTPEEKFTHIVETFRRWIDDPSPGRVSGFVVSEGGSRSSFKYETEIRSNLAAPATPGDLYRGTITVTTRGSYSYRPPAEENAPAEADEREEGASDPLEGLDPVEIEGLDPELQERLRSSASPSSQAPPANYEEQEFPLEEKVYELVYEDDRWVLKTELDEDQERSIIGAFRRALGTDDVPIKPDFGGDSE